MREFICHSTDTEIIPLKEPKGRIYKNNIIILNNVKYYVNDIKRTSNKTQYSLLLVNKSIC